MSNMSTVDGTIRKLWRTEAFLYRDHLLRLDRESRRLRFGHGVSDSFIEDYVNSFGETNNIAYAFFEEGSVRAVAELRKRGDTWGSTAEAAVSVEAAYQGRGIGSLLLAHLLRSAANRGLRSVVLVCLSGNGRMQSLARKHDAVFRYEQGEMVAQLPVAPATPISFFLETFGDCLDSAAVLFSLNQRMVRAAYPPFPLPALAAG